MFKQLCQYITLCWFSGMIGCASQNKPYQDESIAPAIVRQNISPELVQKYLRAVDNKSCDQMKNLINTDFAPKELLQIRIWQFCANESIELTQIQNINPIYNDFLTDLISTKDQIELLIYAAKISNDPLKKEGLYLRAFELAQKNNDPKLSEIETSLKSFKDSQNTKTEKMNSDLQIANQLKNQMRYQLSIPYYKKAIDSTDLSIDEKVVAVKSLRLMYKQIHRKSDYIEATRKFVEITKGSTKYETESQLLLARTLWTEDMSSQAIEVLKKVETEEAYFLLGRIFEEKKETKDAIYYLSKCQSLKYKWNLAWLLYKEKNYTQALELFDEIAANQKESSEIIKALYWKAQSLRLVQRENEAYEIFQKLTVDDPIGYYGLISYLAIQKPIPPVIIKQLEAPTYWDHDLEWLLALKENRLAQKYLDQKKNDPQNQLYYLSVYARMGHFLPLFSTMSSLAPAKRIQYLEQNPSLLFPQKFHEQIMMAAKKSEIDPEFIFAIIRQESAFNPQARSPVDALGLMQLMPATAQKIAQKYQVNYSGHQQLFTPNTNIQLGAFELKRLLKLRQDQFILAIASYNAASSAIDGWLKTRYRENPIEFIEEVPYEETRVYIKLVLRNYIFYRRLLSKKELEFPTYLFKWNLPMEISNNPDAVSANEN